MAMFKYDADNKDFVEALPSAYACFGGRSPFARRIQYFTKERALYSITINVLTKIDRFELSPQKRFAIEEFLESEGFEYDSSRKIFMRKEPTSEYDKSNLEQFIGKYVIIYDLYQGESNNADHRRMLCAYVEIRMEKNIKKLTGNFITYKKEGEKKLKISESGELHIEHTLAATKYIKITPQIKGRRYRTMPVFQFCLDGDEDIKYFRGIGLGFNDRRDEEMVAVRAVAIPEEQFELGRVACIERKPENKRTWESLSEILHSKHNLDREGVINMGASHIGERTVDHIDAIRGVFRRRK